MFKLCPIKLLVAIVAWLTLMVVLGVNALRALLEEIGIAAGLSLTVAIVQFIFMLVFITPIWRTLWKWVPKLNEWIYPDLNGDWDVELKSNYPRIDALLKSAKGVAPPVDFRSENESLLPELGTYKMRARIRQSWAEIEMELWNPAIAGPIKESKTLIVEPFRGKGGRHGLAYVFEQTNETDVVSDDSKFRGAAWIERHRDDINVFCGRMWTDRMWRLGMNTAGDLRFTRQASKRLPRSRRGA
jgi:hypothetical protein